MSRLIFAVSPYAPGPDREPIEYVWSGNWAAVVGVAICVALLILWTQRNDISLRSGKKDWE